jgi:hypothetical protein
MNSSWCHGKKIKIKIMFVVGSMLMVGTPLVQRGKKCHNSWSNEVALGEGA